MNLTRTSLPADHPVTLEEAKAHCRFDFDYEDDLFDDWIATAVDLLDGPTGLLGRAIVSQVWQWELEAWPAAVALPVEPVISVAVKYIDTSGVEQTLDAGQYWLKRYIGLPVELHWGKGVTLPTLSATAVLPVKVLMTCGYGAVSDVPSPIKTAIKMIVEYLRENRGATDRQAIADMPPAISALLARYRRVL